MSSNNKSVIQSGQYLIGGNLLVNRLGFGAMRVTGPGVWGEPQDRKTAIALLKRVSELGVNLIDTANSYGPYVSENIIAEALYPYPKDLVIATKGGLIRPGPDQWIEDGNPKHLRSECEGSLKRLKLECIDLYQLHRIDPKVSLEDQIGVLVDLQNEGKIKHIGLSEVSVTQIEQIRKLAKIVSVQNRYNLVDRNSEAVLEYCTRENIAFIPWWPLAKGNLSQSHKLEQLATTIHATASQLALAWLLKKSKVMLPIPGTSDEKHLEENCNAALIRLDDEMMNKLENI